MARPLSVLACVWLAFLAVFAFASRGDTSFLHITCHLVQLALLLPAAGLSFRLRAVATTRATRWITTGLCVTIPLAVLGILGELVVAVQRLAADGWVNRDTADLWEQGTHVVISSLTIPAMMLSMLLSVGLTAAVWRSQRRAVEDREAAGVR